MLNKSVHISNPQASRFFDCNLCNDRQAKIYCDCYCIFCEECFGNSIAPKWKGIISDLKEKGQKQMKAKCVICENLTGFKKFEMKNEKDRPFIKNL